MIPTQKIVNMMLCMRALKKLKNALRSSTLHVVVGNLLLKTGRLGRFGPESNY